LSKIETPGCDPGLKNPGVRPLLTGLDVELVGDLDGAGDQAGGRDPLDGSVLRRELRGAFGRPDRVERTGPPAVCVPVGWTEMMTGESG
jgi:hypothetical protein